MKVAKLILAVLFLSSCHHEINEEKENHFDFESFDKRFPLKDLKNFNCDSLLDIVAKPDSKIDSALLKTLLPDSLFKQIDDEVEYFFCSKQKKTGNFASYTLLNRGDYGLELYWINYDSKMTPVGASLISGDIGDDEEPPFTIKSHLIGDQTIVTTSLDPKIKDEPPNNEYNEYNDIITDSVIEKTEIQSNGFLKTTYSRKYQTEKKVKNNDFVNRDSLGIIH